MHHIRMKRCINNSRFFLQPAKKDKTDDKNTYRYQRKIESRLPAIMLKNKTCDDRARGATQCGKNNDQSAHGAMLPGRK